MIRKAALLFACIAMTASIVPALSSPFVTRVTENSAFRYGTSSITDGRAHEIYRCLVDNEHIKRLELCKQFFGPEEDRFMTMYEHGRLLRTTMTKPATDDAWSAYFDGFVYGYEFFLPYNSNAEFETPASLIGRKTEALIRLRELENERQRRE